MYFCVLYKVIVAFIYDVPYNIYRMPTIKEILQEERTRENTCLVLFLAGKFWKAYERSAYALTRIARQPAALTEEIRPSCRADGGGGKALERLETILSK